MNFSSHFNTERTKAIAHAIETQVLTKPGYDLATLGPFKAREIIKTGSFDTIARVIEKMREIAKVPSPTSVETQKALEELELDTDLHNEFNTLLERMHGNIREKSLNKIAGLKEANKDLEEEVQRIKLEASEEIQRKDAEIAKLKDEVKKQTERIEELKEINQLLKREIENKS